MLKRRYQKYVDTSHLICTANQMTSFYMKCNSGLKCFNSQDLHCVKNVCIRSFSGLYFLAFGLNTERYSVFSRIWTEYGEKLCISPYSVRMRENTDQKNLRIWTLFTQCPLALAEFIWIQSLRRYLLLCHALKQPFTGVQ